ncbi:hypothetical protein PoB_007079900 [Plakobranchus ocellatus]|uniref:Uncharacterized protein n=1 Tax=Plakobranchus ocellatus TaxID=259542 RepID=A0AAV4DJT5_9GAST|nr:hypothetical protein PoB_007079900 [Plakobranchus ocellatus]
MILLGARKLNTVCHRDSPLKRCDDGDEPSVSRASDSCLSSPLGSWISKHTQIVLLPHQALILRFGRRAALA